MESRNTKALKSISIVAAVLVYAGAVIYGDLQFLTIMRTTFSEGILGALSMAGAVMVGVSALILPMALHFWFAPGLQMVWGYIFWAFDIAVLAMNSILAYALVAGGGEMDALLATWSMVSPATPLIAVIGWGIAFLLDPSNAMHQAVSESQMNMIDQYKKQVSKASKSDETFDILESGARETAVDFAEQLSSTRIRQSTNGHAEVVKPKK